VVNLPAIKAKLLSTRYTADTISPVDGTGVYAFFLSVPSALAVNIEPHGLIYLGMTESSLEVRNHLTHVHSGTSSLRRSLGALLKDQEEFQAIPRSPGKSRTNTTNYRFRDEDEIRLTKWMRTHLTYGFATVEHDARVVEKALIVELCPPLNLTDWPNPQGRYLRDMRAACRNEATIAQQRSPATRVSAP
jgi:hypothetical protein